MSVIICLSVEQRLSWLVGWLVGFICLYARVQGIKGLMLQFYQRVKICLTQKCLKDFGLSTDLLFFVFFYWQIIRVSFAGTLCEQ